MITTLILFAIPIATLIVYLSEMKDEYGMPQSISATYYQLPKEWNWIFSVITFMYVIPLAVIANTDLMIIAAFLICFAAVSPKFKGTTKEEIIHVFGAEGGIAITGVLLIVGSALFFSYREKNDSLQDSRNKNRSELTNKVESFKK